MSHLRTDRRKLCMSSVVSSILQRRAVKTCAHALNILSTAAELGGVQLIFMNAAASAGKARRLSTVVEAEAKYPSTCTDKTLTKIRYYTS
jgi:hypothetical protein